MHLETRDGYDWLSLEAGMACVSPNYYGLDYLNTQSVLEEAIIKIKFLYVLSSKGDKKQGL